MTQPDDTPAGNPRDRRLARMGAVSVLMLLARLLALLPSTAVTLVVIVATVVGLRVALMLFARSGDSPQRARVMRNVSTVGLCISALTVVATLPVITHVGGFGAFSSDPFAQVWTLVVVTALVSPVHTLGWRAYVGAGLTGFLALTALARLIGRPVVTSLGGDSVVAASVWIPLTETLSQALPVVLLVVLAARRRAARPSALDVLLMGAWWGAGFALYEDTQFGRGGVHWTAAPPFSLLFPTEESVHGRASMLIGVPPLPRTPGFHAASGSST